MSRRLRALRTVCTVTGRKATCRWLLALYQPPCASPLTVSPDPYLPAPRTHGQSAQRNTVTSRDRGRREKTVRAGSGSGSGGGGGGSGGATTTAAGCAPCSGLDGADGLGPRGVARNDAYDTRHPGLDSSLDPCRRSWERAWQQRRLPPDLARREEWHGVGEKLAAAWFHHEPSEHDGFVSMRLPTPTPTPRTIRHHPHHPHSCPLSSDICSCPNGDRCLA